MINVTIKVASGGYIIEDGDSVTGINETFVRTDLNDALQIAKGIIARRIRESRLHNKRVKEVKKGD